MWLGGQGVHEGGEAGSWRQGELPFACSPDDEPYPRFTLQEVRPTVAQIADHVDLKASDGLPESSSSDDSSSSSSSSSSSEDEDDAASSVSDAAHSRASTSDALRQPADAERLAARELR